MDGKNWHSFYKQNKKSYINKSEILTALSSLNDEILDLESQLAYARYDNFELCDELEIRIFELQEHRVDLEDQRNKVMERHRLLRKFRSDSEQGFSRNERFDEWLERTQGKGQ